MKRIIINESERKQILLKHNLLFEGTAEDQQVMMKFKNDFMSNQDAYIADGLEKMKSAPGLTEDEKGELQQAINALRKGGVMAGAAKSLVDSNFNKYIQESPDKAKGMLCYLINQHTEYSNPKIKSFCAGNSKPEENKQDAQKSNEVPPKPAIQDNPAPTKNSTPQSRSSNSSIFAAPGSAMNPYGT